MQSATVIKLDSCFDACTGLETARVDFKRPRFIFADAWCTDKPGEEMMIVER